MAKGTNESFTIETERLFLRPLREADTEDVTAFQSIEECVRYVPFGVRTADEVLAAIRRHRSSPALTASGDLFLLGMELKDTGTVIGQVNVSLVLNEPRTGEFGYLTHRDVWRSGYTREAVRALLDYCFTTERLDRVVAQIDVRNTASITFAEQLGLRREATHLEHERQKGEVVSSHIYALLAREWQSISESP